MASLFRNILLAGLLLPLLQQQAVGLVQSNSNSNGKAEVFRVVGVPGGTQFLPAAYVNTFRRWQIDPDSSKLAPIEGSCFTDSTSVNGEDNISVQPTLNFLIKGGAPAYVLAGLLAATPTNNNEQVLLAASNTNHLAQQWTTFAMAAEPKFRIELFLGPGDGTDDRVGVVPAQTVNEVVERLGMALSQTNTQEFASGFHLVTIPVKMDMNKNEAQQSDASMLTCVATAEPDARELLTLDESMLEMTATSMLGIEATQILHTM